MANNTYVNKVVFGGDTLIDLSSDTIAANKVLNGYTAHDASGAPITGSCNYDANTSDATASADDILSGQTAYKNGTKLTGTMTNQGEKHLTITARDTAVTIPAGYHDGSGDIGLGSTDKAALVATNIRSGVTILGIEGSMSGSESINATSATITPYTTSQTIQPSDLGDYNSFSSVTVSAIAYTETDNQAGGKTVTIGTVAPVSP